MLRRSTVVVLVAGSPLFASALVAAKQPESRTPRERYETLLKEQDVASAAWEKSTSKVTPADPQWVRCYAGWPMWTYAPRFVQFAAENRQDPAALDALLKIVELVGSGKDRDRFLFPWIRRSVDMLISDHLEDQRVIKICLDLYPFGGTCLEPYFRALLAKSRDREVLGRVSYALVRLNEMRIRIAARPWFDHPEDHPRFQASEQFLTSRLDPDYISWVRTADPDALSAENERLLERIIGDFSDIPLTPIGAKAKPGGRTLSDVARPKLEAIHSVAVGKVAPDIDGEDIDGKPMKLSQYRGKVVVLVFWGTWCGPCMSLIPHEKALVERLRGRPFALLGINSDPDRQKLKSVQMEKGITWRSWWDKGRPGGPIATRWDVHTWPTVIILDRDGVIRFRGLRVTRPKLLDETVDSLLKETMP